jgi:hypothetical protein
MPQGLVVYLSVSILFIVVAGIALGLMHAQVKEAREANVHLETIIKVLTSGEED